MKIVNARTAAEKPTPHQASVRPLMASEHVQLVHITLQPGEELKLHVTPVDAYFYVLEGRGVVEIGDERREAGADELIESPARIPHRWMNESQAAFRVLVIKVPAPTEATRIL